MGKVIQGPWNGAPSNGQSGAAQYVPADSIGYVAPSAPSPWVAPRAQYVPPVPSRQAGPVELDLPMLTAGAGAERAERPREAEVPELEQVLRDVAPGGIFAGSVPSSILDREPERRPAAPVEYAPSELPAMAPIRIERAFGQLSPEQNMHLLGLATVAVPVGVFAGIKYAGPYGGVAGALLAGAAVNAIRTMKLTGTPDSGGEAVISGTYALLGGALGGYLLYRGLKGRSK